MISTKKAETTILTMIVMTVVILAAASILIFIYRTYFGEKLPEALNAANDCETAMSGSCVSTANKCAEGTVLGGYGCTGDTPLCCSLGKKNKCAPDKWNACEQCEVEVVDLTLPKNAAKTDYVSITCIYSGPYPPCAKATWKHTAYPAQDCFPDTKLSKDNKAVFTCDFEGVLDEGNYEFTCGLTPKGAVGIAPEKTCCVSADKKSFSKTLQVN